MPSAALSAQDRKREQSQFDDYMGSPRRQISAEECYRIVLCLAKSAEVLSPAYHTSQQTNNTSHSIER